MHLSFSQHRDLLDVHGRALVSGLSTLQPDAAVPPDGRTVTEVGTEHWATLEIWSWSIRHPDEHWSRREDPPAPADHPALVAGLADLVARLVASLGSAGPDRPIDYFDRPGRTADVARLLAHESVAMAHRITLAAGRPAPALRPEVAGDGLDHVLSHWSSTAVETAPQPQPVAIRTTDTCQEWHLSLAAGSDGLVGDFRLTSVQGPAAVVQGPAAEVLWWVHGLPEPAVEVTGADADVRRVRQTFLQPMGPAPRRRGWFR